MFYYEQVSNEKPCNILKDRKIQNDGDEWFSPD